RPDFGRYMYNLSSGVLLLRLYLQVQPKSLSYLLRQEIADASSGTIIDLFHDSEPSHVELRKAGATSRSVKVCKYYVEPPGEDATGLEVPRDRLGSLWDRLEKNRLTSLLFHGLTRRYIHHVELFLSEAEFAIFWETHHRLPLKKIQLRHIHRDGLPN